ncbi:hypothetical protein BC833DRAFT_613301 [Globomyces pollinis-pini]|nr:hypothetical protein BC833DRAFT_613301 [Globomyces pollinis-pini]
MRPNLVPKISNTPPLAPRTYLKNYLISLPWQAVFQRLPGCLVIAIIPFTIWGPIYTPFLFAFYFVTLHLLAAYQSIRTCYAVRTGYFQSIIHSTTNWLQKYCEDRGVLDGSDLRHDIPFDSVVHVIILPSYKEDLNTLCETLDILASHRRALTQYRVCLFSKFIF